MTRYLTEFRWMTPSTKLSNWTTPERAVPESLDDVAALISEFEDAEAYGHLAVTDAGTIRVTEIGTGADVTAEALNHFGHLMLNRSDVWPWWLSDICPEWARVEAA